MELGSPALQADSSPAELPGTFSELLDLYQGLFLPEEGYLGVYHTTALWWAWLRGVIEHHWLADDCSHSKWKA